MIPKPAKPAWKGPSAGITQSILIRFCECPFRFYLYAYCGLKEAAAPHDNLVWGDVLHKGLEHYLSGEPLVDSIGKMRDYLKRYEPVNPTYAHTTAQMLKLYPLKNLPHFPLKTEEVIHKYVNLSHYSAHFQSLPTQVLFRGKVDMLSQDNTFFGDHKCKGRIYPYETMVELNHDLQMNLYAYLLNIEDWQYDLIQIPEEAYRVPERHPVKNPMDYADWIFNVYTDTTNGFPIANQLGRWIVQLRHFQPMDAIQKYFEQTIAPLSLRLIEYWDYVCSPEFDPNNPSCYNSTFYQMPTRMFDPSRTDKFKPHFHSILTNQCDYDTLIPVEGFYEELPDENTRMSNSTSS